LRLGGNKSSSKCFDSVEAEGEGIANIEGLDNTVKELREDLVK